jgi:hypothetical protein
MAITAQCDTTERFHVKVSEPPAAHTAEEDGAGLFQSGSPEIRQGMKRRRSSVTAPKHVTPEEKPGQNQAQEVTNPSAFAVKENQGWRRIIRNFTPS